MIPPGLTNLLQPADVVWFYALKRSYHSLWQTWFMEAPKETTAVGHIKSPGYVQTIQCMSQIWNEFPQELNIKSFEWCAQLSLMFR